MTTMRSVSEILAAAATSFQSEVMKELQEHERSVVLGKSLDSIAGSGTGRTATVLAFNADALRLIHDAVLADELVTLSQLDQCHGFLTTIADSFAAVRREYRDFADLKHGQTARFLQLYRQDAGPFGYHCQRTRWASVIIGSNLQDECGNSGPLKLLRETYAQAIEQLATACEMNEEAKMRLIEQLPEMLRSANNDDVAPASAKPFGDPTEPSETVSWAKLIEEYGQPRECSLLSEHAWNEAVASDRVLTILHDGDGSRFIAKSGKPEGTVFTRVVLERSLPSPLYVADVDIADIDTDFQGATEASEMAQESLRSACIAGDAIQAQQAIENGASATADFDREGNTPISVAIASDHLEVVKLLLNFGVGPEDEEKAWYGAISHGKKEIADLLKEAGFEADAGKAFAIGCRGGDLELAATFLLKIDDIDRGITSESGPTAPPMVLAAETGSVDLVRSIMNAGASVDATDENLVTPWIAAAARGWGNVCAMPELGAQANVDFAFLESLRQARTDVAEQLLEAGANPNAKWSDRSWWMGGQTALESAFRSACDFDESTQICSLTRAILLICRNGGDPSQFLQDGYPNWKPPYREVHAEVEPVIIGFLDDLEIVDANGDSLLTKAISECDVNRVALLLHHGAALDYHRSNGNHCAFAIFDEPSNWEVSSCYKESFYPKAILDLLIGHGFDLNTVDVNGESFRDKASQYVSELSNDEYGSEFAGCLLEPPSDDGQYTTKIDFLIGKVSVPTQAAISAEWFREEPKLFASAKELMGSDGFNLKRIAIASLAAADVVENRRAAEIRVALDDSNPEIRYAAMQALRSLGEAGIQTILHSFWNCSAEQVHHRVTFLLDSGREAFASVGRFLETELDESRTHDKYLIGMILGQRGRWHANRRQDEKALDDLKRSVRFYPNNQLGHWEALSDLLNRKGNDSLVIAIERYNQGQLSDDVEQERELYRQAHALFPEFPWPRNNLAWSFATCDDHSYRDGAEALRLATNICETEEWDYHGMWDTLSAAYLAVGEIDNAIRLAERAVCTAEPHAIEEYEDNLIRLRRENGLVDAPANVLTIERARRFVEAEEEVDDEGITEIDDTAAFCLGRLAARKIQFKEVFITPKKAVGLSRFKGSLWFKDEKSVNEESLKILCRSAGGLVFDVWEDLTPRDSSILMSKTCGVFGLMEVSKASDEALDIIAEHPWAHEVFATKPTRRLIESMIEAVEEGFNELDLISLRDLRSDVARALASSNCDLRFHNLERFSDEAFELLCNCNHAKEFGGLSQLTEAQQMIIGNSSGGSISFPDLEKLTPEMADRMSGFPGDIVLTPTSLDQDFINACDKLKHPRVELGKIQNLTLEGARFVVRVSHPENFISAVSVVEFDVEAAKVISESGRSVSLRGLESISDETASVLRSFSGPRLWLHGLRKITVAAAKDLASISGELSVNAEQLEPHIAAILCPDSREVQSTGVIELTGPEQEAESASLNRDQDNCESSNRLTRSIVKRLLADPDSANIDNFTSITRGAAEELCDQGCSVILDSIESLDKKAAEGFSKFHGHELSFDGLVSIDQPTASVLASTKADLLYLNGIKELTTDVAMALKDFRGELHLAGLRSITEDVAAALAMHRPRNIRPFTTGDPTLVLPDNMEMSVGSLESFNRYMGGLSMRNPILICDDEPHRCEAALAAYHQRRENALCQAFTDEMQELLASKDVSNYQAGFMTNAHFDIEADDDEQENSVSVVQQMIDMLRWSGRRTAWYGKIQPEGSHDQLAFIVGTEQDVLDLINNLLDK